MTANGWGLRPLTLGLDTGTCPFLKCFKEVRQVTMHGATDL